MEQKILKSICPHCLKNVRSTGMKQHQKSKKCLDSRDIVKIEKQIENTGITQDYLLCMLSSIAKAKLIKKDGVNFTQDQLTLIEHIL